MVAGLQIVGTKQDLETRALLAKQEADVEKAARAKLEAQLAQLKVAVIECWLNRVRSPQYCRPTWSAKPAKKRPCGWRSRLRRSWRSRVSMTWTCRRAYSVQYW